MEGRDVIAVLRSSSCGILPPVNAHSLTFDGLPSMEVGLGPKIDHLLSPHNFRYRTVLCR